MGGFGYHTALETCEIDHASGGRPALWPLKPVVHLRLGGMITKTTLDGLLSDYTYGFGYHTALATVDCM